MLKRKMIVGLSSGLVVVGVSLGIAVPIGLADNDNGLRFLLPLSSNDSRQLSINELAMSLFVTNPAIDPSGVAMVNDDQVEFQYQGDGATAIINSPIVVSGQSAMDFEVANALSDQNNQVPTQVNLSDEQIVVIRFSLSMKQIISLQQYLLVDDTLIFTTFNQIGLDASNALVADVANLDQKIQAVTEAIANYDPENPNGQTTTTTKWAFNNQNYDTELEAQNAVAAAVSPSQIWLVDSNEYIDIEAAKDAWVLLGTQTAQIEAKSYDSASAIIDGTPVSGLVEATNVYNYFLYDNKVYPTEENAKSALVTALNLIGPKEEAVQGTATAETSTYPGITITLPDFDFGSEPDDASVASDLSWAAGITTGDEAAAEVASTVTLSPSGSFVLKTGETAAQTADGYFTSGTSVSSSITEVSAPVTGQSAVQGEWNVTSVAGQTLTVLGLVDGSNDITTGSDTVGDYVDFTPYVAQQDATLSVKGDLSSTSFENYTVTLGAGFDGSNVDLSNITLTEDTAPNPGGPTAGEWSGTINGATVTIVGPSDGTNGASLAAGANNDLTAAFDYTAVVVAVDATLAVKGTLPTDFSATLTGTLNTTALSINTAQTLNEVNAPSEAVAQADGEWTVTAGAVGGSWQVEGPTTLTSANLDFVISGGSAEVVESRETVYTLRISGVDTTISETVQGEPIAPSAILANTITITFLTNGSAAVPWDNNNLTANELANISALLYSVEVTNPSGENYDANNVPQGIQSGYVYDSNFYNTMSAAQDEQKNDFNVTQSPSGTWVNFQNVDYANLNAAYAALITEVEVEVSSLSDKFFNGNIQDIFDIYV